MVAARDPPPRPELLIWRISDPDAPPTGVTDPDLLVWCEAHGMLLVTNNRKSMPGHLADHLAQGRHVPGILVIDPAMSVEELAEELSLVEGASLENEFRDQIRYLPLS
jgi:hypothetical protein